MRLVSLISRNAVQIAEIQKTMSAGCDSSRANVPQLDAHNIKLLAVVTQGLVTKSGARF
jgi:hypothetical protein